MSKGQASPRRAQPEDVGSSPLPTNAAMPQPSALPDHHTLARPPGTSHSTVDVLNIISSSSNNSGSSNSSFSDNSSAGRVYPVRYLGVETTTPGTTTEDYAKLKEEFYQSYSPLVGLHTAAVLGGILGWLIIYLLYKTKVKKWVISFVKKKYKKRKQRRQERKACEVFAECQDNEASPNPDLNPNPNPNPHPSHFQYPPYVKSNQVQKPQPLNRQFSHPRYQPLQQDPNPPPQGCWQPQPQEGLGCQNPPSQQHRTDASCYPGDPMGRQQQQQQQQRCPMPSIVVESYSSLPVGGAAAESGAVITCQGRAEQPQADSSQPQVRKARKKSGRQEKAQQQQQQEHRQQGREKRKRSRRKRSRSQAGQCPEVTVLDVDEPDTKSLYLPSGTQADAARATARLVLHSLTLQTGRQLTHRTD